MSLLSAYKQQCRLMPDNIALTEGEQQLSYQQLEEQVNRLSSLLNNVDKSCRRVVIAIDRGIDAVIAILAVLNIGACYIPLDLKNPGQRLAYIVNDVDAQYVLGQGHCPEWLVKTQPQLWLDIDQADSIAHKKTVTTDIQPEALATILYTSGSTGHPKGVALSHRALENFTAWAMMTFHLGNRDRIASLAPFYFDLSVFDLFASLSCGASVHFVPPLLTFSPSRLTAWLKAKEISIFYTVPSLLCFMTLKGALDQMTLPCLKTILFAGEVFSSQRLIQLCDLLPQVNFYNLYGPTETNVCCYWPIDRERLQPQQTIPIGQPACGSILWIAPDNGELWVKSANNLSGYWQQGALIPALNEQKYYATGDRVSVNEHGEYCFHGRLDRMLKCSGYRVEPAEIERTINGLPQVECCAVVGVPDIASGQRPAVAMVLHSEAVLNDIIKPLKQKLPSYMQPSKFMIVDALPRLANGKIDYQILQKQLEGQ